MSHPNCLGWVDLAVDTARPLAQERNLWQCRERAIQMERNGKQPHSLMTIGEELLYCEGRKARRDGGDLKDPLKSGKVVAKSLPANKKQKITHAV
jgi:hypothetical protein